MTMCIELLFCVALADGQQCRPDTVRCGDCTFFVADRVVYRSFSTSNCAANCYYLDLSIIGLTAIDPGVLESWH